MTRLPKIILFFFIFVLCVPLLQQELQFFSIKELNGAFVKPKEPELLIDSVASASYQKSAEDYLNTFFGFRESFVRMKNTIEYLLWKEIPVTDNIEGKDGFIFSKGSIRRTIGLDYNGAEKNRKTIERILFLNEGLKKHGSKLLVVFAPSKECVLTNNIPAFYSKQFKANTDYLDLTEGFKKQNIPLIDFCDYFRKINDTSRFPLFTKTGFHWSAYGASVAHDSLLKLIASMNDQPIPSCYMEGVEYSDTARWSDNDLEAPMNLLYKLDERKYVYPILKMDPATTNRRRPKVVAIGDSFFWQLKDQKMMMNIFTDNSAFWYYFAKTSFPIGDVPGVPLESIDVMQELESADVVLLIGSMGTLGNFPFGVTDYYYDRISSPEMTQSIADCINRNTDWSQHLSQALGTKGKVSNEQAFDAAKAICRDKGYYNLVASNGLFVCEDPGLDNALIADKKAASTWEKFGLLKLDGDNVALLSFENKFLRPEPNGNHELKAKLGTLDESAIFTKFSLGNNKYAFRSSDGFYLSYDKKTGRLFANTQAIGPGESFLLVAQ